MHLRSGIPYWSAKNGLLAHHRRLVAHARCEIAVMGAGITGALIAHALARRGHDVRVLEAVEAGWGDTAACMAMLSGDPGTPLVDLAALHGEAVAMRTFHACAAAIEALTGLVSGDDATAVSREAGIGLRYASRGRDCGPLRREFEFRRRLRLDVEWLERDELDARHGLQARCAILSRPAAAIDPYFTTHALLEAACRAGAQVHARTHVVRIRSGHRGVRLETSRGLRIQAKHLVLATGPAAQTLLPAPIGARRIGCILVTNPLDPESLDRIRPLLIRDTSHAGMCMRTTPDGRLMIGGDDDAHAVAPQRDEGIGVCARSLLRKARRRLPALDLDPAFGWAGTHIASADGLPYFGTHALTGPRIHYAMAYGDNGIAFSSIGADIIADAIEGRAHPLASTLDFSRLYGIAA